MITANRVSAQPVRWQQLWREAIGDPHELLETLGLADQADALLPATDTGFALRVPRGFVARMRHGDASDPLLLQVLPQAAELGEVPGFTRDAVGDHAARAGGGVLHKYRGRALLLASGTCAVNCRYCFRRHYPYAEDAAAANHWQAALAWLAGEHAIGEVILSGGDPLSLATPKLAELGAGLVRLPHVRRLRIHSRLPVVLPERIDAEFIDWLAALPLQKVVVLHANHPNEIDAGVAAACAALRASGATVLNQSVLLRRVNDDPEVLAELSERLFAAGVLPYYLHQLDRVAGTAHFEVEPARARALQEALRDRLPGYLVPRLVREVAGAGAKQPL
ncbi:EF-P beta-lysylation protein EpmB [Dokdonella sp.]|uniref:EF-P beta-lysylation protein EpmB n=1 Tax=Dokdonella sp. TaxID=2291710 RepID=UPI0031CA89E7|nr:EF-P beta-lysylation protein EpmB [Dokdonella sp.]